MSSNLNRRDFLKLAGLLSGNIALPPFLGALAPSQSAQAGNKNVLIVVFDALSAFNISLYGYRRETTPNITRLAERAIVYHNHFATGNFTTPGTASLLTGVYPWTHRAFQMYSPVTDALQTKSIFHAFNDYYRIAYSHNPLVTTFFNQFQGELDDYIPIQQLFLTNDGLAQTLFRNDDAISSLSWRRAFKKVVNGGYSSSLFLADLYQLLRVKQTAGFQPFFPLGLPSLKGDNYFVLEQAIDFLSSQLNSIPQPFLAYFHFLPPHEPYRPHRDFVGRFTNDAFQPPEKSTDIFKNEKRITPDSLLKLRTQYDEYILYLDREFGRFFTLLEDSGLLENTWLILTSDHGELFERGISGHYTPVLYQPVIRIPLLIFEPRRTSRLNIHALTSAVDVLPTLLHITGGHAADWSEGIVLPPFADISVNPDRNIYALEAKTNQPKNPLTKASVMLVKGRYKLTYYFGYAEQKSGKKRMELYDLEADPEELNDLYVTQPKLGMELLDELKSILVEVNKPYRRSRRNSSAPPTPHGRDVAQRATGSED
jgi:arylsulfatase A-like enzyme